MNITFFCRCRRAAGGAATPMTQSRAPQFSAYIPAHDIISRGGEELYQCDRRSAHMLLRCRAVPLPNLYSFLRLRCRPCERAGWRVATTIGWAGRLFGAFTLAAMSARRKGAG